MNHRASAGSTRRASPKGGDGQPPAGKAKRSNARRDLERTRGAQLVHDLSGSLAAISLHLQMAAGESPPAEILEHISESLRALRLSRGQLVQIDELLRATDGKPAGRRRRSS